MLKGHIDRIIRVFLIIFIAWISFVPEPLKYQYNMTVKLILFALLALSLYKHGFSLSRYFIHGNEFFWLYMILFSLNIWFASDWLRAHRYYSDFLIISASVYFLVINEIKKDNARNFLYALCVCAAMVSMLGFLEMISGANFLYERFVSNYFYGRFITQHRMMSTLIHPNVLGSYLITCAPLAYYFYRTEDNPRARYINLVIFLFIILAVFLTFSRGD